MKSLAIFIASLAMLAAAASAQKRSAAEWLQMMHYDTMEYLNSIYGAVGQSVGEVLDRSDLRFPVLAVIQDSARAVQHEYLFSLYPRTDSLMRGLRMAVDTPLLKPGYYLWDELDEQTRQAIRSRKVRDDVHRSTILVDSEEQDFACKRNFGRPRSRPDLVRAYLDTLRIEKRLRPFAAYRNAGLDYRDYFELHDLFYRDTDFYDRPIAQLLATYDIEWKTRISTETRNIHNEYRSATVFAFSPDDIFQEYYYALIVTTKIPGLGRELDNLSEWETPVDSVFQQILNHFEVDRYNYGWIRNLFWDSAFEGYDDEMLRKIMQNRNRIMYEQKEQTDKK